MQLQAVLHGEDRDAGKRQRHAEDFSGRERFDLHGAVKQENEDWADGQNYGGVAGGGVGKTDDETPSVHNNAEETAPEEHPNIAAAQRGPAPL